MSAIASSKRIPSPPGRLPIVGHALQFAFRPLDFLASATEYGDILSLRVGKQIVYLVTAPDLIHRVLTSDGPKYTHALHFESMEAFVGDGIGTSSGKLHAWQRKMLLPAFRPDRVKGYADIVSKVMNERIETWKEGQIVNLEQEMKEVTLLTTAKALFNTEAHQEEIASLCASVPFILSIAFQRMLDPTKLLQKLPLRSNRRFDAVLQQYRQFTNRLINERRKENIDHNDFLSTLILERDQKGNQGMSDRQIHNNIMSLLLAATANSAANLMWIFHLIGTHPEVEQRLFIEISSIVKNQVPEYENLHKLVYADRIISESLRLYPPLWIIPRKAVTEVELGTHRLPKDSLILLSPYGVHHSSKIYPEPERFNPDRWVPENMKAIPQGAFIPFGDGGRRCIGESFAGIGALMALAVVTSRYRLRPLQGYKITPRANAILAPKGLFMRVERIGK